jgi:nicotianamine synthase
MAYTTSNMLAGEKTKAPPTITTMPLPQTPPHTPSITTAAAHKLATEIYDIYHSLINLPNLKPGNEVNALLTRLVDLCIETYDRDFVADFFNVGGINAICSQLRSLCATAEGELESFWAQKLISESLKYNGQST